MGRLCAIEKIATDAVFVLIGARTHEECWMNRGRVDAVVETPCGIYVFEFKLGSGGRDGARPSPGGPTSVSAANQTIQQSNNQTIPLAAQALAQIREKGYAEKYLRRGKKVTLVGAAFAGDPRPVSYIGVNYNPADGVRTTDDVKCERAEN